MRATAKLSDLQEQWYRSRDRAMKEFVTEWTQDNQVPYEDDSRAG